MILGFSNGVIHTPPDDIPGAEWAKEFHGVHVVDIMMFECIAAGLVGAGIGLSVHSASVRRRTFALAVFGGALGVGYGWVNGRLLHVPSHDELFGSELVRNLIPQAIGVLLGLVVSEFVGILKSLSGRTSAGGSQPTGSLDS